MAPANPAWEFKTEHDILIACVGTNFGERPEERLDDIRRDRGHHGEFVCHKLALTSTDQVADLGSGCGFATRVIAPHVAHIWCIDISSDFLQYARAELSEFSNVSYCLASYAEFPNVQSSSLDACYSTAVFIHFNYYDLVFYLMEINRVLKVGGRLLLDFLNSDRLDFRKSEVFQRHFKGYKSNRAEYIFNFVHPFSLRTLEGVAAQIGFSLVTIDFSPNTIANDYVVLQKVADSEM